MFSRCRRWVKAEKAKAAEEEQRELAEESKSEAERAKEQAEEERDNALHESYYAKIGLVPSKIESLDFDQAKELLV